MISDKKNKYTNFENIFSHFMETVDDLIIITSLDDSFKIEYVHDNKFLRELGYTTSNLLGKSLLMIIDFGRDHPVKNLLRKFQQPINKKEVKIIDKKGNFIWAELNSFVFFHDTKQEKLLINLRDISKTKELEKKVDELEHYYEKISKLVPEIRFWEIFTPKKFDLALKESEAILKTAIESLPYDVFMINKNGYYTMQNSTCKQHWGDVIGKRPKDVAKNEDTFAIWNKNNFKAFSGETVTGEVSFQINGKIHHFYNVLNPVYINDEIQYIIGINIDITEKKDAEKKLEESEELFRNIAEQSLMGICIIQDFEIKYANERIAEIYGYSLDEIKEWNPKEFLKVIHLDSREMLLKQLEKYQDSEDITTHYIAKIIKKNGNIRYIENYSKIINFQGRTAYLLTQIDITAKMIAEQKLQSSEEKYRHLYENSPNAILLFNLKGEIFDCNLISEELSGSNREYIIGQSFQNSNFIPKKYLPILLEDFKALLKEKTTKSREIQLFKKEGTLIWVNFQASLLNYENEKIIQVIIQNIDEKKKAEEKLRSSEKNYRSLFENSPIGLMIQDYSELKKYVDRLKASGINNFEKHFNDNPDEILKFMTKVKVIDVNRKTLDIYRNYNKENFIFDINQLGKSIDNIMTPEVFLHNKLEILSLIQGKTIYESEIVSKTFTGDTIHLYAKTSIVPGFESTWSNVIVSIVDITDKILVEENLRDSEEKYHNLFETSPDGVILVDLKGNIIECNSAIKLISGYSPQEFIGKNFIKLDIYYENGLDKLLEGYKDLLGDNQLESVEFPIKCKNKKINWVKVRATLINMKGNTYILAVIHDITTQKQAEIAIKASEKKYRELLESSSVGVIEIDLINNQIIYMNPKLVEIIGYNENELMEDHFLNKLIHPKDLRKLLDSSEESELEFRIYDRSGKLKWLTGKKIPHYDNNEKIISIRIWLEDITEKKNYETLIYELNVNFLNFTADIRNNIQLLLNTCLNLLNGDFILYINRTEQDGQETYQILTSDNKTFMCDSEFFAENLFVSALFYESHDFPQTFFDIDRINFANTDPFIVRYHLKGAFGKLIKTQKEIESAVCVFYKVNPLISNQDKLVMFLICDAIEIEQRRWQVQRGLEEQNITLNKINSLKSELFSRTSHELKTPLISIKGFTELLLTLHKHKLDNEVLSILKEVKEGSKRLEKIINLLLESTKLEAGQLELNLSKEDLIFLIKFCVNELKGLAKLRNQSIILKLHDSLETLFDKERIYEVFSNLLVNAIKYTPPNGKIIIESAIKKDYYIISVEDDGIGFTPEEKRQVFKQFGKIERYGQGWDVSIEGTGLGLYITKKLVELHGGKIWLESEGRNKGSTFYFSIPIK